MPASRSPAWTALQLCTDAVVDCAIATSPGTPQFPPLSHGREPGGLEIALAMSPPTGK